ncbi:metallophosphatase family protein [Lysobacter sp. GX 14042]|uniref:metallophosphoesterase family protein n=1 Tax=Lysobacter sp. GX 14042 TaxID=2907155 RepID=UPI001F1B6B8E|nr:metallophosphoesterase family protein [Lysobacter sp. GX 14042]MCE7032549.1 metallophosphatase family protein [Lysobacter sp. GX 14042]
MRISLISDTHGKLRPEARAFLAGCDHIVHAGDIGKPDVLADLEAIAPVTAIRGNVDTGEWAEGLPEAREVVLSGVRLLVLHDLRQLAVDPAEQGIRVVVSGHSHKPLTEEREGVLYVNPGSAGPRRFSLPVTAGELLLSGPMLTPRIVNLLEPTLSP